MADEDVGFLTRLTGSPVDEAQIARDRVRAAIANPNQGDAGLRQMFFGLGQQAAGGIGSAVSGLVEGTFGREEGERFFEATARGTQESRDKLTSRAVGISPNELRTRRRIRSELSQIDNDGTTDARIKLAQRAAKIAAEEGDMASLGRALDSLKKLKVEEQEFNKLSAETKTSTAEAAEAGLVDAFRPDGSAITGQLGNENGTIESAGGVGTGIWFSDDKGELVFERFGSKLSRQDPTDSSTENTDQRIRKLTSKKERELIRSLVVNNDSSLRKSRRVIKTLNDLNEKGGVESVVGTSGTVVTFTDDTIRNIRGLVSAFTSSDATKKDNDLRSKWISKSGDVDDDIWSILPDEFRRTGAAARQYRAQIMEMAYMAARLAEPSNRGLSDNDIKNALVRIAGDSSNPQAVVRRFIEMQADSAAELETRIQTIAGSLPDISDEEIEKTLAGNALPQYRKDLQKLYDDFGISIDENGRAVFQSVIDTDVQPGEGSQRPEAAGPEQELNDDEFLNQILGESN